MESRCRHGLYSAARPVPQTMQFSTPRFVTTGVPMMVTGVYPGVRRDTRRAHRLDYPGWER